jgi:Rad3-related DNA helicase
MILPPWAETIRPNQVIAIQNSIAEFNSGKNVVLLDAPTGSGKTLIGELVRQQLHSRALYLCSSISLQTQFARDFPYASLLKGRSNYPTRDNPSQFPKLNAGDCNKERTDLPACSECRTENNEDMHCRWCHPVRDCPYESAKRTAIRSELVCTNTAYFLYEANFVGNLPINRQLIIVDEADTLEDQLLSFVSVTITQKRAKEYGIEPPSKKTVESAWVEWAKQAYTTLANIKIKGDDVSSIRNRLSVQRLLANVQRLNHPQTGLAAGGWVYTGYDRGDISFKPIDVNHLAKDYLWRHCGRFLLMSATTISFPVLAETLGLDQ